MRTLEAVTRYAAAVAHWLPVDVEAHLAPHDVTLQARAAELLNDVDKCLKLLSRLPDMELSDSDTAEVECPACDNGKVKDWQHEDDGARQWAVEIELVCEVCGGHGVVPLSVERDYKGWATA
jgi:hypothetical protein